jgi:hypothetical protein
MVKFLFGLALLVHGCFALAVQHFEPNSKLLDVLAKKKLDSLHTLFPVAVYPPKPPGLGGYLVAALQTLAGFLILKRLARL